MFFNANSILHVISVKTRHMVPYNMATYSQKRYSCCVDSKICRTQRAFHVTTMKDIGWKQFGVESSWKMVTCSTKESSWD